jgi:hypothetical protein
MLSLDPNNGDWARWLAKEVVFAETIVGDDYTLTCLLSVMIRQTRRARNRSVWAARAGSNSSENEPMPP